MSDENAVKKISDDAALTGIGEAYYNGIGMPVDYKKAFSYYSKAARLGNANALSRLGNCYEYGYGTKKNPVEALNCYEDAAAKGEIRAACKLGDYYRYGTAHLVQKDQIQAAEYYTKALKMAQDYGDLWNVPDVYLRMADCLISGIGMEKDIRAAYDFYCSAADGFLDRIDSGDRYSSKDLDLAEKGISRCEKLLGIKNQDSGEDTEA